MQHQKIVEKLLGDLNSGKVVIDSIYIEDQIVDITPNEAKHVVYAKTGYRTYKIVTKDGE